MAKESWESDLAGIAQKAESAWAERRARILISEHLDFRIVPIHEKGFYLSLGPNVAYVNVYNKKVDSLLKQHGLPEWAPILRAPTREESFLSMLNGCPINDFAPASRAEATAWDILLRQWKKEEATPKLFVVEPTRKLILLGGSDAYSLRVDVLDVDGNSGVWMKNYELTDEEAGVHDSRLVDRLR